MARLISLLVMFNHSVVFLMLRLKISCQTTGITIQNFHLGRYLVLRRRTSEAIKHDFRPFIRGYTSPNENFEYNYSNALQQLRLKLESCKPHKAVRHQTKCDVINYVKLFPTV